MSAGIRVCLFGTLIFPGLAYSASVGGIVYGEDGVTPLANARVEIVVHGIHLDGHTEWSSRSTTVALDGDGAFLVPASPGRVRVSVRAPGFAWATSEAVELAADQDADGVSVTVASRGGTVEGRITFEDGSPAAGVLVFDPCDYPRDPDVLRIVSTTHESAVQTDAEGLFRLEHVPVGTQRLRVYAEGYPPGEMVVEVAEAALVSGELALRRTLPGSATVSGVVMNAQTGEGVPDAMVSVFGPLGGMAVGPNTGQQLMATTTATGGFFLYDMPPGKWGLTVYSRDYPSASADITVGPGDYLASADVEVSPGARLGVAVLDMDGLTPVANQRVVLHISMPPTGYETTLTTDAAGTARWPGVLPAGHASITVARDPGGRSGDAVEIDLEPGGDQQLTASLAAEVSLRGVVVDADSGEPVAEATVQLCQRDAVPVTTNAQGGFGLPGTPAGEFDIVVMGEGYVPSCATVSAEPAEEPLRLQVRRGATVSGVAVDRAGKPVARAHIALMGLASPPMRLGYFEFQQIVQDAWQTTTDAAGRFAVSGVAPGNILVLAVSASESDWAAATANISIRGDGYSFSRGGGLADIGPMAEFPKEAVGLVPEVSFEAQGGEALSAPVSVGHAWVTVQGTTAHDIGDLTLAAVETIDIQVTVLEPPDGTPVADRQVEFRVQSGRQTFQRRGRTDAEGHAVLRGIPAGDVSIAAYDRIEGRHVPVTVNADGSARVEVPMPTIAQISGVVVEADTGDPVPGAVVATAESGGPHAVCAQDGRFILSPLPPGPVRVFVLATGRLPGEATVEGDGARLELQRGGVVTGRVVDAQGAPANGAIVGIACEKLPEVFELRDDLMREFDPLAPVTAGPGGRFEVSGVPEGFSVVLALQRKPQGINLRLISSVGQYSHGGSFPTARFLSMLLRSGADWTNASIAADDMQGNAIPAVLTTIRVVDGQQVDTGDLSLK